MPLVGLLVSRIDTRVLVSTGFAVFGICSLIWGTITLQISPWSMTVPIVISGFLSASCLFRSRLPLSETCLPRALAMAAGFTT